MQLFWHRRDLRLADNRGLARAAGEQPVVPVFVFDPDVLEHAAPPRVAYMLSALESLRASYQDRGSDLLVCHGTPEEELLALAADLDAEAVVWNEDYSGLARRRDDAVRDALDDAGVAHTSVRDAIQFDPGSITTTDGEPYSVYTYFWRKWRDREKEASCSTPPDSAFADAHSVKAHTQALPRLADLGFREPEATIPRAGIQIARERLETFCSDGIYSYADDRDYPARANTSRLSADLKWGTIGIREVYEATENALEAAPTEDAMDSVTEFQSQLAWREFYTHVLNFTPNVVTQNYNSYEEPILWREDPQELQAWKDGTTGYPLVDAGMRQLRREAYVHNRVRIVVASFLTKDLQIDWREGYDWYRQKLIDHDTANDNGGWQWAASTGTDAQPYFRVFNPMSQCEQYDPDGEYVRSYIPELRDASTDAIHNWHELEREDRERIAPEYPDPIVDHQTRRSEAIEMFEAARGD